MEKMHVFQVSAKHSGFGQIWFDLHMSFILIQQVFSKKYDLPVLQAYPYHVSITVFKSLRHYILLAHPSIFY